MPSAPKATKAIVQDIAEEEAPAIASPKPQAEQKVEEPLPQYRPIVRREIGVPSMDTQQTILVNAMEGFVMDKLDSVLARFKCCKCDRCKKDIVAMALNKLPAKYMVIMENRPSPDPDPQTSAQVLTAMIQSVLAVRAHPRH